MSPEMQRAFAQAYELVQEREHETATSRARASLLVLSRLAELCADQLASEVARAGATCAAAFRRGGKVLACGNGGSAADAQHFVAELVGRMGRERPALPAISLQTDPSVTTCIANDYGYEKVFRRQIEALGHPEDVLVAISTSGRSPNVLEAIASARTLGMATILLLGEGADISLDDSDVVLRVPSMDTPRTQEIHTALLHAICEAAEDALFDPR